MAIDANSYVPSFSLLVRDFRHLSAFVEPHDDNLNTYSHRLYELQLRACTEFESLCKDALSDKGFAVSPMTSVTEFKNLEPYLQLQRIEIGWHQWRPQPQYVRPFLDWTRASPALQWYSDYNRVKHNRSSQFALANLANVRLAISAVFAMVAALELLPHLPGHVVRVNSTTGANERFYVQVRDLSINRP